MSVKLSNLHFSLSSEICKPTERKEVQAVSEDLSHLSTVRGATIFRKEDPQLVGDVARARFCTQRKTEPRKIILMIVDESAAATIAAVSAFKAEMERVAFRALPKYHDRFVRLERLKCEIQETNEKRELDARLRREKAAKHLKDTARLKRKNLELIDNGSDEFYKFIAYYFEFKPFGAIRIAPEKIETDSSGMIKTIPKKLEINPWFFSNVQKTLIKQACEKEKIGYGEFSTKMAPG